MNGLSTRHEWKWRLKIWQLAITTLFVLLIVTSVHARVIPTADAVGPRVTAVEGEIAIGKTITVTVEHLSTWTASHDANKLEPYINGRELKGLYPEIINSSENKLRFHLLRTAETRNVWESFLREPVLRRPVTFSVGLESHSPFATAFDDDHQLPMTVIPKSSGIASLALILGGLILLVYAARKTNMLRESGSRPASGGLGRYDEGRVQIAFWFFIITSAYLCLWLITGDVETLTSAHLGLMGISGVSAMGSHLMRNRSATTRSGSAGFFNDILSDDNGYSFMNFQMLAWTFLLGIMFMAEVYDDLAMPKFTPAVVALTGISSVTYLGFKFIKQQNRNGGVFQYSAVVERLVED